MIAKPKSDHDYTASFFSAGLTALKQYNPMYVSLHTKYDPLCSMGLTIMK